jgi:hydroxyacylglutathione hydrolase
MQILRWQVGNDLKNYQYLLADEQHDCVAIDPFDLHQIDELLIREKLTLRAILLTHEHPDHADGAVPLQQRLHVPVYTSAHNVGILKVRATAVPDGARIKVTPELQIVLRSTPGHTAGHAAFEINGFLFSGDCLFHGGCGHCRTQGAKVDEHFRTINQRLAQLSPDLILMPGHYYAARNLDFCLHVEPGNERARSLRARIQTEADEMSHQATLKQEADYNPFLRLSSPGLRRRLAELTGHSFGDASDLQVFRDLRRLRDSW